MARQSLAAVAAGIVIISLSAARADLPRAECCGDIEPIATLQGPMPTGVAVSKTGRIFVNFPRWGDPIEFTVAELKKGEPQAYPDAEINRVDAARGANCFVSVQSVVVDSNDRLWVLDTGRVTGDAPRPGGAKLVGIDLASNTIFKKVLFPADVVLPTTYLNDVRFDLRRGAEGFAFITDSSGDGPNAIIVVDLASGRSWRKLNNHFTTRPEPNFVPMVEGRPLMIRPDSSPPHPFAIGADGIAISPDGQRLYYCPLSSHGIYSVAVDALVDAQRGDRDVEATIAELPRRNFASDGLEMDARGWLYLTDYEDNAILRLRIEPNTPPQAGDYETIVYDSRALWPDTLCVAADGYLYFTANQLHRQAQFHGGRDQRVKPYVLFRAQLDLKPPVRSENVKPAPGDTWQRGATSRPAGAAREPADEVRGSGC